jgi:hypothetical protein
VLFALLFGASITLIRMALPEGAAPGSQWAAADNNLIRVASLLMPFAGIAFLWFIGVVRDGFGRYEDKFFASVFLGSGLLFLAMVFGSTAAGMGLAYSSTHVVDAAARTEVVTFGQLLQQALGNTYALRMAAVFMMSLATIWLKTGLMPRWLVFTTYLVALVLLVAGDVSTWLPLVFPIWVLVVSVLLLAKAAVIGLDRDSGEQP